MFAIPTRAGNHNAGFTTAAGTESAHIAALVAGKSMAMTVIDLLERPELVAEAKRLFDEDHPNGIEVL